MRKQRLKTFLKGIKTNKLENKPPIKPVNKAKIVLKVKKAIPDAMASQMKKQAEDNYKKELGNKLAKKIKL
jgi:hypothetical protein